MTSVREHWRRSAFCCSQRKAIEIFADIIFPFLAPPRPLIPRRRRLAKVGVRPSVRGGEEHARSQPPQPLSKNGRVREREDSEGERYHHDGVSATAGLNRNQRTIRNTKPASEGVKE